MPTETMNDVLGTAIETVLETMFFTMADGEVSESDPLPSDHYRLGMSIDGACQGSFEVQITTDAAREIAGNFTGVSDPAELTENNVLEVMAELTNMICGSMLSEWAGDKIFSLSTPSRIVSPRVPDRTLHHSVRRAFALGSGVLVAEMEISECQP